MKLKKKGEEAQLGGIKQCMMVLKWTTATDFDLAAAYRAKNGHEGLVYFGDKGNLNAFPFMEAGEDKGVGDTGGDNQEELRITKFDEMDFIWLLCWDYGAIEKGAQARFKESDVIVSLLDDKGTNHAVSLDTGDLGNICLVATIDNTSPMGAKLINDSKAGVLKGLNDFSEIMSIINA